MVTLSRRTKLKIITAASALYVRDDCIFNRRCFERRPHLPLLPLRLVFPQFSQALIIFHFIISTAAPKPRNPGWFYFLISAACSRSHAAMWCAWTALVFGHFKKNQKKPHVKERRKVEGGFLWHIDGTHGQTTELNWQTATAHVF